MQNDIFYQNHLNNVSRSFAFCIAKLPQPLKLYVGLSYLLCRVLDTIEDSHWSKQNEKQMAFLSFQNFLNELPEPAIVKHLEVELTACDPKPSELDLFKDFYILLQDFHSLPASIKNKLAKSITCMCKGMGYFSDKYNSELKLKNLAEVNQYCFFVAGIVGELLTDTISEFVSHDKLPKDIYVKSHHFGLFLQKINILKDQKSDEAENKFFIHNKEEFILSIKNNAQNALQYILAMPVQQKEFRLFCCWSLFIGLSSLSWVQNSFISQLVSKIPRWMTEQLISKTELIINDNAAIQKLFNELLPSPSTKPILVAAPIEAIQVFQIYYQGHLSYSELSELLSA
jgi:phytoene/squalene synthetase